MSDQTISHEFDELAFLRFFYDAAGDAFGPADRDIYIGIRQEWEDRTGQTNPPHYHGRDTDE